jgi:chromate transporter
MIYGRLALVFTVLSLLGFGGGNAIIPQMHADVVDSFHWITSAEFTRFFALAKLAPGPTTTMAALVGYAVAGILGATVATIFVFVPAGMLVFAAGHAWGRLKGNPWRERFATAIKPVVLGLIWAGAVTLAKGALDGPATIALAVIAAGIMLSTNINQIFLVLGAGAIGAITLR